MSGCGGVRDHYCKLSDFTVEKKKKKKDSAIPCFTSVLQNAGQK